MTSAQFHRPVEIFPSHRSNMSFSACLAGYPRTGRFSPNRAKHQTKETRAIRRKFSQCYYSKEIVGTHSCSAAPKATKSYIACRIELQSQAGSALQLCVSCWPFISALVGRDNLLAAVSTFHIYAFVIDYTWNVRTAFWFRTNGSLGELITTPAGLGAAPGFVQDCVIDEAGGLRRGGL